MRRLVSGIILHEGRVLLVQRAHGSMFGGKWVLPEGEMAAGDSWMSSLVKAVHDETGLLVNTDSHALLPYQAGMWPGLRAVCHPLNRSTAIQLAKRLTGSAWVRITDLAEHPDVLPGLADDVVAALEGGMYGAV